MQSYLQQSEVTRSYRTREFYFLKQGIFEHRTFSKYIVKCRKERQFLDFGKKMRDESIVEDFNCAIPGQHR